MRAIRSCRVRHETNVDAAVLGATVSSFVGLHRVILAQSDEINLVGRDALLRSQILNHSVGPTLAQVVVVVGSPDRIGSAFNQ